MAHMHGFVDLISIERLSFPVIAPLNQIKAGVFGNLVTKKALIGRLPGAWPNMKVSGIHGFGHI